MRHFVAVCPSGPSRRASSNGSDALSFREQRSQLCAGSATMRAAPHGWCVLHGAQTCAHPSDRRTANSGASGMSSRWWAHDATSNVSKIRGALPRDGGFGGSAGRRGASRRRGCDLLAIGCHLNRVVPERSAALLDQLGLIFGSGAVSGCPDLASSQPHPRRVMAGRM